MTEFQLILGLAISLAIAIAIIRFLIIVPAILQDMLAARLEELQIMKEIMKK